MSEIEAQEPQTMLVNVDELNLQKLFGDGKTEEILTFIRDQVSPVLDSVPDVLTAKGRQEIKSAAYKVARSKTAIDDAGKQYAADLKATVKKIDSNRKLVREALDDLKNEVRAPVDAWEKEQAEREEAISRAINTIIALGQTSGDSEAVRAAIDAVSGTEIAEEVFGERTGDAAIQKDIALSNLERALKKAEKDESDAAELEKLRREKEEREQEDRIRAREKAAAEQAAAQERARAEKAEEEAQEARDRAEQTKREADERVQAERDAARRRAENEKREADARAADKEHRRSVNRAAADALTEWAGLSEEDARKVITVIAAGQVPNVKVGY